MKYNLNKQLKFFFVFFPLFVCAPLLGEEKTLPAKEVKSIVIKAAHLKLKAKKIDSAVWTIKWTGNLSFHSENGLLTIVSSDFNSKKSWGSKSSRNVLALEIYGPAVPIELFSFSSKSSFSDWTKPVFVSSFKGSIEGFKNKGLWELSLKEGEVDIHHHQGPLSVKGFHVNHRLFSSKGGFKFHINEGLLEVKKSEGQLDFTTNKAKIKLTQFKGSLKGFSQSGEVTVFIQPEKVDLFAGEGAMRVYFMKQAPKVKAYTERGKIYGPRYLYKKFSGKSTEVSGQIRGLSKKGTAVLKSDIGNIYIN